MGKLKDGILGAFTGKVGPLVAYQHRGQNILKKSPRRPPKRRKPNPNSLPQRMRMTLASQFVRSVAIILRDTIWPPRKNMTNKNFIVQQVMKLAIAGEYPDLFIDYSKVPLSQGFLPTASKITVSLHDEILTFTWLPNAINGSVRALDEVLLLAYNTDNEFLYFKYAAGKRNDGKATLSIDNLPSSEYETWMIFLAEKGKDASPTIYCGKVVVPQKAPASPPKKLKSK